VCMRAGGRVAIQNRSNLPILSWPISTVTADVAPSHQALAFR